MPFTVCPHCQGSKAEFQLHEMGKQFRCPRCRRMFGADGFIDADVIDREEDSATEELFVEPPAVKEGFWYRNGRFRWGLVACIVMLFMVANFFIVVSTAQVHQIEANSKIESLRIRGQR